MGTYRLRDNVAYTVYLRLVGKFIVDFIFVLIELFRYGRGATSENRMKISVLQQLGELVANFRVEGDVPHQSFLHR